VKTTGKPSSPQFRTALIRKLKNIAPDFHPEFVETVYGVSFRMIDKNGRARSDIVTISRNPTGSTLARYLRSAGFPNALPAPERRRRRTPS
jgi:hypothetical protein